MKWLMPSGSGLRRSKARYALRTNASPWPPVSSAIVYVSLPYAISANSCGTIGAMSSSSARTAGAALPRLRYRNGRSSLVDDRQLLYLVVTARGAYHCLPCPRRWRRDRGHGRRDRGRGWRRDSGWIRGGLRMGPERCRCELRSLCDRVRQIGQIGIAAGLNRDRFFCVRRRSDGGWLGGFQSRRIRDNKAGTARGA